MLQTVDPRVRYGNPNTGNTSRANAALCTTSPLIHAQKGRQYSTKKDKRLKKFNNAYTLFDLKTKCNFGQLHADTDSGQNCDMHHEILPVA